MPAPRPIIGLNDMHLLAKVLDAADEAFLCEDGDFTSNELRRARQLFSQMDQFLDETLGADWDTQEALV